MPDFSPSLPLQMLRSPPPDRDHSALACKVKEVERILGLLPAANARNLSAKNAQPRRKERFRHSINPFYWPVSTPVPVKLGNRLAPPRMREFPTQITEFPGLCTLLEAMGRSRRSTTSNVPAGPKPAGKLLDPLTRSLHLTAIAPTADRPLGLRPSPSIQARSRTQAPGITRAAPD